MIHALLSLQLHQRRKNPQYETADLFMKFDFVQVFERDLAAFLLRLKEIIPHDDDAAGPIQPDAAFKMQE